MRQFPADNELLVKAFKAAKSAGVGQEFVDTFGDTIYIKHADWSYEQEYRLAIDNGNRGVMWPGKVTAIYLGMNASPQYCRIIGRIQQQMGPQPVLFKMTKVPRSYALEPRPLSRNDLMLPGVSE